MFHPQYFMKNKFTFSNFRLLLAVGMVTVVFNSYAREERNVNNSTTDAGVVINGVKWATRNVDASGTFAATPESAGMFYQWNRPKGLPATGTVTGWDSSYPTGTTWEKSNDPCPSGWRVPTIEEQRSLLDTDKVTSERTTQNGVTGRLFTDKNSGNSIFLPGAGYRFYSYGTLSGAGAYGYCWSSTQLDSSYACYLSFGSGGANVGSLSRSFGFSVRCVAE